MNKIKKKSSKFNANHPRKVNKCFKKFSEMKQQTEDKANNTSINEWQENGTTDT